MLLSHLGRSVPCDSPKPSSFHFTPLTQLRFSSRIPIPARRLSRLQYWYMECIVLLHRFFFTGVIHSVYPETRVQIFAGGLGCLFAYIAFLLTRPFHHDICDVIGGRGCRG